MTTERFRFTQGSLYEYDAESNAYIHVYKSASANTKKKAIAAYFEES